MGMTPTQLYSIPQVCKAAQSLLDIHGEVGEEEIPMKVQEVAVCASSPCTAEPESNCHALDMLLLANVLIHRIHAIRHVSLDSHSTLFRVTSSQHPAS